jgi:hypothetical protein
MPLVILQYLYSLQGKGDLKKAAQTLQVQFVTAQKAQQY